MIHIILVVIYQAYALYIPYYHWYLNIPNIFHMCFITEHVILNFCIDFFFDDIQTVLWLRKLIISELSVNHK